MQGDLREKVAVILRERTAPLEPVGQTADAIIATLREELLSEEVVEAVAQAMHVAASMPHLEIARAALSAALDKIGAPNAAR